MSKSGVNAPEEKKGSVFSRQGSQKLIVLLVVIFLFIFFSVFSANFRKYTTVLSIMDYSYYIVLMAIGVTFPLITGGVDLSIGTGLICYSLAGGYLIVHCGWPTWAGMLVSILFGVLIGTLNGVLVSVMSLPPFLATLCTCMITRGLALSVPRILVFPGLQAGQREAGSEIFSRLPLGTPNILWDFSG